MEEDTKVNTTYDGEDLIGIVAILVILLKWVNFMQILYET
jgi:hypothetical protein